MPATKSPRQENFFDLWKYTFCPKFSFCSAIFFIVLAEFLVYLAELIHTLVVYHEFETHHFLGIQLYTLQEFGMRMPWLIEKGHVHRLFMPTFLSFGISQLAVNIILQMALGTLVEAAIGAPRFVLFFITVCLISNMFGAVCYPFYSIGAEPFIYGCIGGALSILLVYWPKIQGEMCAKICAVIMMVLVLVIATFLISGQAAMSMKWTQSVKIFNPDLFGSIGGLLSGFFACMYLTPIAIKENGKVQWREVIIAIVGLTLNAIMVCVCLPLCFTGVEKTELWYIEEQPEPITAD